MAPLNFYRLLGVARTAKTPEIRKAYRELVLKYHPDRNPGDKNAEDQFKVISEAYRTLSDAKLRLKYDLLTAHEDMPRITYPPGPATAAATKPAPSPQPAATVRAEPPPPPRARTGDRGLKSYLNYQTELNELDAWDGVLGIVFGSAATLASHAYLRPEDRRPEFVVLFLWILVPFFVGPTGYFIGKKLQNIVEDSFNLEDSANYWTIAFVKTLPLLFTLALSSALLVSSQFFRAGVFTWRVIPAAIAGGLAAIGGSGVGRAFVIVSTSRLGKIFGASVGGLIGFVGGLVVGLCLALFSGGRGFDILFFEGFFSAGVGGAVGGLVASFIGSFREARQDDF